MDLSGTLISPVALATRLRCGFPVYYGTLKGEERRKGERHEVEERKRSPAVQSGDCLRPKGPPKAVVLKEPLFM